MTDAEFNAWLASPNALRCVLLEATAFVTGPPLPGDGMPNVRETTRYMSTRGYVTRPTDTPANTVYEPVLAGGISLRETIGFLGTAELAFGDVEIANPDGRLDGWANDVWSGREVRAFIGDVRWARADFRVIYVGIVEALDSRVRSRWNLRLRDKLARLNTPVMESKYGGSNPKLKDQTRPVVLGEVHNIQPVLAEPAVNGWQFHHGQAERVIEVRDNGVPVGFTAYLMQGGFTLNATPYGTVTASVQGDAAGEYASDAGAICWRLAIGYGRIGDRFTPADIDSQHLSEFRRDNPQPVGIQVQPGMTVLEAISQVAASVGARPVMSRLGQLRLVKVQLPPPGVPRVVTPSDMAPDTFKIAARPPVVAARKIGYCKNWTVQTVTTGILPEHKELFAQEWLTFTSTNQSVAQLHKLRSDVEQEDTMLLRATDAATEGHRRLTISSVQRTVYEFEGYAPLLFTELGSPMTLVHPRFGLAAGKTGQVVSLAPDWIRGRIVIGVLV